MPMCVSAYLYMKAVVVGDYLYIDGGEIGTWNGTGNITYAPSMYPGSTLHSTLRTSDIPQTT